MKTLDLIFREVDREIFERIKNGEKTIEVRAGSPEYSAVAAGDQLNIICGDDHITKIVEEARHFQDIGGLLDVFRPDAIMPAGTTREQAIAKLNSFPNYPERIAQYGIIAWHLK